MGWVVPHGIVGVVGEKRLSAGTNDTVSKRLDWDDGGGVQLAEYSIGWIEEAREGIGQEFEATAGGKVDLSSHLWV